MMDSSPSKINVQPTQPQPAGVKRPAPTLLPAFEPLSSSPGLPRPSKKRSRDSPSQREAAYAKYPTPVPTSTTGILSSSPPRGHARPGLQRSSSIPVSERAPLSTLPSVLLSADGHPLLMGRSSNSSQYQLSANRLISRVHVRARYIAASVPLEANKIEIVCQGWNGLKLHCQGRTWELAKGDSFTSETEYAEIMLDVQDARVLIRWPGRERKESESAQSESSSWEDEEGSPKGVTAVTAGGEMIQSSPLRRNTRLVSPVSPSPAQRQSNSVALANLFSDDAERTFVQVYEDEHASEDEPELPTLPPLKEPALSFDVEPVRSQSSDLSEPEEGDPNEENDPVVHSFGPFGANLNARMASFTHGGSPATSKGKQPARRDSLDSSIDPESIPIVNHVVNQLAFSRLQSTPLSVIMNNLPAELKSASLTRREDKGLANEDLRKMLNKAACVGEINREGKDAAGKVLESEYYYMPDKDSDTQRREAVVEGLRKPSLRNCRKQHKQYYWKRPRTP